MRRSLFFLALVLMSTAASAQQVAGNVAAIVMYRGYVAVPMRTYDEAVYAAGRGGAILATSNADAPFLVLAGVEVSMCVAPGAAQATVEALRRNVNRGRLYLVEPFADHASAQRALDHLQTTTYTFFRDAAIVDGQSGSFLLYRNPDLQY